MSAEDKNKEYTIFQIASNLAMACIIAGLIIGIVYFITAPVAAQQNIKLKNQAMQALVPEADKFNPVAGKTEWYEAQKSGKTIAYVVPGETKGFGGKITMLVAVTPDGKVIDFNILEANETPGLGDNASKEPFRKQFKGKTADDLVVVKDPSNTQNIQAMTGATISSRAVTKGIKEAVEQVTQYAGGK